jgi:hypothetical protein
MQQINTPHKREETPERLSQWPSDCLNYDVHQGDTEDDLRDLNVNEDD